MLDEICQSENIFLIWASLSPMVLTTALLFAVRRLRLHERVGPGVLVFGNSLVFLFLSSLIVFGGEVYFRFFSHATDSFGMSKVHHRWFARHFQYNCSGFRDNVNYRREIPAGKRRITFLGDSFTAGHGISNVDERFANRLRAKLDGVEIHCAADTGWDTGHHIEVIEHLVNERYVFDVVVLVYVLNDLSDIMPEKIAIDERFRDRHNPGLPVSASYLFNMMYLRCVVAQDPVFRDYDHTVLQGYQGKVWQNQKARLKKLRNMIRSNGGELWVVTFPYLHDLGANYAFRDVHRQLDEFWQSLGVPNLDLLDVFEPLAPGELVVNRFDAHPNEKAHATASDAMMPFLVEALKSNPRSGTN